MSGKEIRERASAIGEIISQIWRKILIDGGAALAIIILGFFYHGAAKEWSSEQEFRAEMRNAIKHTETDSLQHIGFYTFEREQVRVDDSVYTELHELDPLYITKGNFDVSTAQ